MLKNSRLPIKHPNSDNIYIITTSDSINKKNKAFQNYLEKKHFVLQNVDINCRNIQNSLNIVSLLQQIL